MWLGSGQLRLGWVKEGSLRKLGLENRPPSPAAQPTSPPGALVAKPCPPQGHLVLPQIPAPLTDHIIWPFTVSRCKEQEKEPQNACQGFWAVHSLSGETEAEKWFTQGQPASTVVGVGIELPAASLWTPAHHSPTGLPENWGLVEERTEELQSPEGMFRNILSDVFTMPGTTLHLVE